jgi:hypothetical protein
MDEYQKIIFNNILNIIGVEPSLKFIYNTYDEEIIINQKVLEWTRIELEHKGKQIILYSTIDFGNNLELTEKGKLKLKF